MLDANWLDFQKLWASLQWRKLCTQQRLNLSSNPDWMHSPLSNTLQRSPPAGHLLLPFLIFFSAICLGHKTHTPCISGCSCMTGHPSGLRAAKTNVHTNAILIRSDSLIPSRSLSGVFECHFVHYVGREKQASKQASSGGAYLLPPSDEAQTKGGVHEAPACTGCKRRVREKGKKTLAGCLLKSHRFYKLKSGDEAHCPPACRCLAFKSRKPEQRGITCCLAV